MNCSSDLQREIMTSLPRYLPSLPLPKYKFVPGQNPHPKKNGGHMEGEKDPVALPVDIHHPESNESLRYAIDLFNHEFYWESHVYFEALWNAHGRVGSTADFFKGMIKLGAAGVKADINQVIAAKAHLERAKELFSEVMD